MPLVRLRAVGLLLFPAACAGSGSREPSSAPSRYLAVWAGTGHDSTPGLALMNVLDADPASAGYGSVIAALAVDSAALMPHHMELSAPDSGPVFANDYNGDKSFVIDVSAPPQIKLVRRLAPVPGGHHLHSFARLANGHVIATIQFGDGKTEGDPGGLAEFDGEGNLIRTAWSKDSAFPGAAIRTYALTVIPESDRLVTTSSPMTAVRTANVVQIWRLSDLSLLKTLAVPEASDSGYMYPFELKTMADGSVLMNTYYCGFYHITNLADSPRIERVMALPLPQNTGCSVPLVAGKFWVMPVAYAHRYVTLDISDPAHPKEVASFATDTTFFPHWISGDPGSDRVVVTDQGDGPPMVRIARLDRETGRMSWDTTFTAKFKEMVMPHGAVFVR